MIETNGKINENDLARVKKWGQPIAALPCPTKNGKIYPQTSRFLLKGGRSAEIIHIKPIYYETLDGRWRPMEEITNGFGNRWAILNESWEKIHPRFLRWWMKRMELMNGRGLLFPIPKLSARKLTLADVMFTVTTVFPDPDPETTTFDAKYRRINDADYATAHDAADASSSQDAAAEINNVRQDNASKLIERSIFGFDTSSIPDLDVISAATMTLFAQGQAVNDVDNDNINIYSHSGPASSTSASLGDYNVTKFGSTGWATAIDIGTGWNTSVGAANDFVMNSTGIDGISKTGVTWIGNRTTQDASNTAPSGNNSVACYTADQTGTSTDPTLVITHAVPFTPQILFI